MKKIGVVALVLCVVLLGLALYSGGFFSSFNQKSGLTGFASSTPNTCDDSQTILKLSSPTNAHGALWNDSNYNTTRVCYDSIFGVTYNGTNPHNCNTDGSNFVLNLSSNTNAHAEIPSDNNYKFSVCYGDLVCRKTTGACDYEKAVLKPGAGKTHLIASLSSDTNAHLANDYSYSGWRICCTTGGTQPELCGNGNVDAGEQCDLGEKNGEVGSGCNSTCQDVPVEPPCTNGLTLCEDGKCSLNCTITDTGPANHTIENMTAHIKITSPVGRCAYVVNESIFFNASESNLKFEWSISDTNSHIEKRTSSSFNYSFTTPGEKRIELAATDSKGVTDTDKIEILVIGIGAEPYAFIDAPEEDSVQGQIVAFSGAGSYVINSLGAPDYNLTCLGGNCPIQSDLCSNVITDPAGKRGDYSAMYFRWTFWGDQGSSVDAIEGFANVSGQRVYSIGEGKGIELLLNNQTYTYNLFKVRRDNCSYETGEYYDMWDNQDHNTSVEPGYCDRASPECCIGGYSCVSSSKNGWEKICEKTDECVSFYDADNGTSPVVYCEDYNKINGNESIKKRQCEMDLSCNQAYKNNAQELIDAGHDIVNQQCMWNNDSNSCGFSYNVVNIIPGGILVNPTLEDNLTWFDNAVQSGSCENGGTYTVTHTIREYNTQTSTFTESAGETYTTERPCAGKTELPFFAAINIVIAIVAVILIYLVNYPRIIKNKR